VGIGGALSMSFKFDIFHVESQGSPMWRASAKDLQSAKEKVKELSAAYPGEYFLFDQTTATKLPVNLEELN
jgi:hypothetical protein